MKQIIEFVTNEKELILDQYAGSFSLAEAALDLDRDSISIEISQDYFEEGKKRIENVKKGKVR